MDRQPRGWRRQAHSYQPASPKQPRREGNPSLRPNGHIGERQPSPSPHQPSSDEWREARREVGTQIISASRFCPSVLLAERGVARMCTWCPQQAAEDHKPTQVGGNGTSPNDQWRAKASNINRTQNRNATPQQGPSVHMHKGGREGSEETSAGEKGGRVRRGSLWKVASTK